VARTAFKADGTRQAGPVCSTRTPFRHNVEPQLMPDRILSTHVGSLPRPDALIPLLQAQDAGKLSNPSELRQTITTAVNDAVQDQLRAGVDHVSDGEMSKWSYTSYIVHRLSGFGGEGKPLLAPQDLVDNSDFAEHLRSNAEDNPLNPPACIAPLEPKDEAPLQRDLSNLQEAVLLHKPMSAFMNAASPGVLSIFMPNEYYPDEDAYIDALADVMRDEYEAIIAAGFDLQIDAPDLAMGRHTAYRFQTIDQFKETAQRNLAALNHATRNIDPTRMRLHLCWGNYPGPHTHDVPLAEVFDLVMQARPSKLLFESANARHAHEAQVFKDKASKIPDDKVLVPGVIDTNSNCVEHPEVVAQRLLRFADIVGKDRVMAGTDCGFSTVASRPRVFPTLVWKKLAAMSEGARIASEKLWR